MIKRIIYLFSSIVIAGSLFCGKYDYLSKSNDKGGTGTLTLTVSMATVKSIVILPETSLTPASFTITGTGPEGNRFQTALEYVFVLGKKTSEITIDSGGAAE